MKTVFDHIENLKAKPHHVRRRVAFGTALGVTAAIALVWLVGSVTSGVFAIQGSNFAESTGQEPIATTSAASTSGLAGAAAALPSATAPAHIEIVDATSSAPAKQANPTVIPF